MQGTINYSACLIGLMSFFTLVTTQADAKPDFASPVSTESIKLSQPIAIENSAHIPVSILNELRDCKIVCIGEFHGSKEIPEFVGSLASELSDDGSDLIVGLELSSDNQEFIDGYMKTGDEEILKSMPIFNCPVQDGRGSAAMAGLIKHLRTMPNIKVVTFDPLSAKGPQDRDTRMAEFLAAQLQSAPNKRLLILCGNVHAANRVGMSFDRTFCPMANRLAQLRPDDRIYTIVAKFRDGITWSLTPNNQGGPVVHKRKPCSIERRDTDCYFLPYKQATHGYNAELFIRTLSLSEPYRLSRSEDAQVSQVTLHGYNPHLDEVIPQPVVSLRSVTAKHHQANPSAASDTIESQSRNGQSSTVSGVPVSDPLTCGSLTGVGITLGKQGKKIVVMQFMTGGVADAAGIQKGDEIVSVDGKPIGSPPTIDGVVKLIRGPVDSKVSILIQRGTTRQTFTMTRVLFRTPIDGCCPAR